MMTFLAPAVMDFLAVNDQERTIDFDVVVESAVNGVVLQHVRQIIRIEQVVDSDNFDVLAEIFERSTENHAADTAETIDTDFDSHFLFLLFGWVWFYFKKRFSENPQSFQGI